MDDIGYGYAAPEGTRTVLDAMLFPFLLSGVTARRQALRADVSQQLTSSEVRVLHYLPTRLTAVEIARELYLSVNTVKTHMRHLYAKLDAHRRMEAVERARALGLLAPSPYLR